MKPSARPMRTCSAEATATQHFGLVGRGSRALAFGIGETFRRGIGMQTIRRVRARFCQQSLSRCLVSAFSPRAEEGDGLVALVEIKQAAQRLAARSLESRVVLHDA